VIVEKGRWPPQWHAAKPSLGAQLLCELAPVPGIDIVGPLPDEVQKSSVFAAAVMCSTAKRAAAQAFLDFLGTAAVQAAMRKKPLHPCTA